MLRLIQLVVACLTAQLTTASNFVVTINAPLGKNLKFREIEVLRDGVALANDMMVWEMCSLNDVNAVQCFVIDSNSMAENDPSPWVRITTHISFDQVVLRNSISSDSEDALVGGSISVL
jgi:hypothetical protein